MIGISQTIPEARKLIDAQRSEIDAFECSVPQTYKEIDWGPKSRGQGKRNGHMVQGSMSDAPHGIKRYYCTDMSKYRDDFNNDYPIKFLERPEYYYRAREFGCNHIEALYYAIT